MQNKAQPEGLQTAGKGNSVQGKRLHGLQLLYKVLTRLGRSLSMFRTGLHWSVQTASPAVAGIKGSSVKALKHAPVAAATPSSDSQQQLSGCIHGRKLYKGELHHCRQQAQEQQQ